MFANTFTTEFSIAGAALISAARAVAPSVPDACKAHSAIEPTNPSRIENVMFAYRVLFAVPRAVHDGRSAVIQGAAARLDTVLGLKILGGIEIPEDLAVDGRIRAQMPVHRSRECAARHDRDRLPLCVRATAVGPGAARLRRGGVPTRSAGGHVERRQASAGVRRLRQRTRDGDIETAVIRRAAPGDAAGAARDPGRPHYAGDCGRVPGSDGGKVADFRLPQNLAAVIRIQSVDDS